jgi:hypothetical protein
MRMETGLGKSTGPEASCPVIMEPLAHSCTHREHAQEFRRSRPRSREGLPRSWDVVPHPHFNPPSRSWRSRGPVYRAPSQQSKTSRALGLVSGLPSRNYSITQSQFFGRGHDALLDPQLIPEGLPGRSPSPAHPAVHSEIAPAATWGARARAYRINRHRQLASLTAT